MTLNKTRRSFLKTAALGSASVLALPAYLRRANAAQSLTIATLHNDDDPDVKAWNKVAEVVEQKLPGQFSFNIVKNAALGGEKEMTQGIRLGSIQGALTTVSVMSAYVPETQILDLPFLFKSAEHLETVTAGEVGQGLAAKLAKSNFIVPAYINYGARQLLTKEPVLTPDQLKGKVMRVIQSPLHTKLWAAYGANPTGIPINETYNALSTGVADCMDLTKAAYAAFKLYEVVPDMTETAHIWAAGVMSYGAMFWNGLSDDQQEVFTEASKAGCAHFNALLKSQEVEAMAEAAKGGGKVFQPEDRPAWVAGAKPVWSEMADKVGGMEAIEAIANG
ncbi:TRAP transporter substrate-binding protein [Pseudooceanicola sp. GBMRC 2024]|uniref:TRAP transporter substrate-binding protein n=1 Tax=Pseudooceanicola albus TaxID=2692189 RepID=A0A6L7G2Y0_9RHOB|nr:TRAP transporter substrate-binding protein [Pseudooceanicola albus]MXN17760.1 TRAP transporter substrate-binding protein [Pseudooceanicola albus]